MGAEQNQHGLTGDAKQASESGANSSPSFILHSGDEVCSRLTRNRNELLSLLGDASHGLKAVTLTTDGSCPRSNPGPAGWACILRFGSAVRELSGSEPWATNNAAEFRAIVEGLRVLRSPCAVTIRTDSKTAAAWCRLCNKPKFFTNPKYAHIRNLITDYRRLTGQHRVTILWVKGHAGDLDNERCDRLALAAAKNHFTFA